MYIILLKEKKSRFSIASFVLRIDKIFILNFYINLRLDMGTFQLAYSCLLSLELIQNGNSRSIYLKVYLSLFSVNFKNPNNLVLFYIINMIEMTISVENQKTPENI